MFIYHRTAIPRVPGGSSTFVGWERPSDAERVRQIPEIAKGRLSYEILPPFAAAARCGAYRAVMTTKLRGQDEDFVVLWDVDHRDVFVGTSEVEIESLFPGDMRHHRLDVATCDGRVWHRSGFSLRVEIVRLGHGFALDVRPEPTNWHGEFIFHPAQAGQIDRIAARLGIPVRNGSAAVACGVRVHNPLDLSKGRQPDFFRLVIDQALGLDLREIGKANLRLLADAPARGEASLSDVHVIAKALLASRMDRAEDEEFDCDKQMSDMRSAFVEARLALTLEPMVGCVPAGKSLPSKD